MPGLSLFLQNLLSSGVCPTEPGISIQEINKKLRPLSYEAVEFPSTGVVILKDLYESQGLSLPWKENMMEEIKGIITVLAGGGHVSRTNVVDLLVERGWLSLDGEHIAMTERSLVQFEDFIESLNGRYRKCLLCGRLTGEERYHSTCSEALNRKIG